MSATKTMRIGMVACAMLACVPVAAAQQQDVVVKPKTVTPQRAALQGFNVVLVLGDLEAGPVTPDNVPVAARKALADMKDFLPYKSYRLLDTTWILSANGSASTTLRLRGPDEKEYELALNATSEPPGAPPTSTLRMTFQLRDPGSRELAAAAQSSVEYMRREMEQAKARRDGFIRIVPPESDGRGGRGGPALPDEARAEINQKLLELAKQTRAKAEAADVSRKLIDTGFTMEIGETVVVGTSRVRGEKAIIALLTAVPRGKKQF